MTLPLPNYLDNLRQFRRTTNHNGKTEICGFLLRDFLGDLREFRRQVKKIFETCFLDNDYQFSIHGEVFGPKLLEPPTVIGLVTSVNIQTRVIVAEM